ncbi:thioredoxin domain-containing protein [Candidatus Peregrinibacteria bacterium]|nr:thioredoxin domain-containing protein [Candidatus Peregrinibacteria bacterium]
MASSKHLPALSLAMSILLCACTLPVPPANDDASAPANAESEVELVEEVFEEAASSPPAKAEVVTEKLLPSGFLQVGRDTAPVTLRMFTEHHCRYCKDFHEDHMPLLEEEFIATGQVKMEIGILTLKKYLDSDLAAMGLLCAGAQGKGLAMHGLLFASVINAQSLPKLSDTLKMDTKAFNACLKSEGTKATLTAMESLAQSLDVTLVPTFFINGEKSVGLPYYADLRGAIEEKLGE